MAEKDNNADVDAKVTKAGTISSSRKRRGGASKDEEPVSQALRTVYQRAVDEDVPLEMLDLLKKLD